MSDAIHWYPGHMTKAKRAMQEDIKLIDIVIELLDARAPLSSRNPDIDRLGQGKARLILLNKSDLSDASVNKKWEEFFKDKGYFVLSVDARNNSTMKPVLKRIEDACREKIERDRKRGIINRPIRAMIVGIPNVGKSTLVNSIAKKACTKVGNKPGVTKGKQWIRLSKNVELLDTPGILWPKFEDQQVGRHLAMIGSINDQILPMTELAAELVDFFRKNDCNDACERYNISTEKGAYEVLSDIAVQRKALKKGGEPDIDKAALLLFDDFRSGRLGRISLEQP